ncbi:MAG: substrate-binding domain-containing protein [Butyricicoccus sp.]
MKITIRKIAEMTGVSRGTVDKVVHGRPGVSEEVRAAVQAKIDELGYQPPHREHPVTPVEKPRTIAVIIPRLSNPFFRAVKEGMDTVLPQYHDRKIHVEYRYCDGTSITELLAIIDELMTQKVDGLILRGSQSKRLGARIDQLTDAGIPVVLYDSDVPGCRRLCMVGENSGASGRVAASLLAKSIGERGEVAIMGGQPDMATHRTRLQGFQEVIRDRYPNIQIVDTIYSNDQSVIAYEKTGKLVQQYPNLRGIYSVVGCTGDIGLALIERKMLDVKIVCYNFTDDIIALVKRGIVSFAIGLTPFRQGSTAMQALLRYLLEGEKPKAPFLEMPILIGVDENIEILAQNQNL